MSLLINKKNNALFTVVLVVALGLVAVLAWNPYIAPALSGFQPLAGVIPPIDEEPISPLQCQSGSDAPIALDKVWKITLKKNTGGNIGTSTDTIVIYESASLAIFEDNLDPASGVVTTGSVYKSGDTYDILYNNSNTQHWFRGIEVPYHCVDTDSNHYSQITSYAIGTYVITLTYSGNTTSMETSGTYNYTSEGTTPSFTVRIDNTADNTGIISSVNPITGRDYKPVLQIIFNGTGFDTVTMKSAQFNQDGTLIIPQYTQTVTKRIWSIELSEENLSREVRADGTVVQAGTTSISFQLNLAGVSVDTVDMFIQLAGHTSNSEINDFGTATANDGVSLKEHLINIQS